jgi:hypothetical protein
MKGGKGGRLTKRLIGPMTVGRRVHAQNHTWEVDVHACFVTANKTTTPLTNMGPETVDRNVKHGDV